MKYICGSWVLCLGKGNIYKTPLSEFMRHDKKSPYIIFFGFEDTKLYELSYHSHFSRKFVGTALLNKNFKNTFALFH